MQKRLFSLFSILTLILFFCSGSFAQDMGKESASHDMMKGMSHGSPVHGHCDPRSEGVRFLAKRCTTQMSPTGRRWDFKVSGVYADGQGSEHDLDHSVRFPVRAPSMHSCRAPS